MVDALKARGINTVFHLPLAVSVEEFNEAIVRNRKKLASNDEHKYDVSFVGSLYTDEHNYFDMLYPNEVPASVTSYIEKYSGQYTLTPSYEDIAEDDLVDAGVKAMKLDEDGEDRVIGMISMSKPEGFPEEPTDEQIAEMEADPTMPTVLVLSEQGFGKRSSIFEYRITNRNGKGVKTINVTEKTGKLVAIKSVTDDDDLMIINKSGITIRLALSEVRIQGRNTQGVKFIDLKKRNDVISSVCKVDHEDETEEDLEQLESATPEESFGTTQEPSFDTTQEPQS